MEEEKLKAEIKRVFAAEFVNCYNKKKNEVCLNPELINNLVKSLEQ